MKVIKMLLTVLFVGAAVTAWSHANAQQLISFDAPNAGTGPSQGTVADAINVEGTVAGNVTDNGGAVHGFVGTIKGGFTDFDAPGAGYVVAYTYVNGINDSGVIVGNAYESDWAEHGYVRMPNGKITMFDAPGASYGNTQAMGINNLGVVVGFLPG